MKLKMLKLTLFFLTVGLLSSSKQNGTCLKTKCDTENVIIESNSGGGSFGSDVEKVITPGNFIFSTKNF